MNPLVTVALASAVAVAGFVALPPPTFRTHAVLALDGGPATLRPTLVRVAADTVVSKQVIDWAAATLLAGDSKAPAPDLSEVLSVAAGGKAATSQQARLADAMTPAVHADPGIMAGTLDISATAPVAEQAARYANALADAFVTQQDDAAIQARLRLEEKASAYVEEAKAASLAARRKLIALGVASDPVQARNAASAQTAAAETRLATIRMIMASGSPPTTDRKDLPAILSGPQATYLDVKAQLSKESETLGERHTTIIGLQDGLKKAAATLVTEWGRLRKIAEADVVAAHEREAVLRKSDAPADAKRRDAIEDARRAVQVADQALAFAQKQQDIVPDEASFRLIARAPVPKVVLGYSVSARLMGSMLAGLASLALVAGLRAMRRLWRPTPVSSADPVFKPVVARPTRAEAPASKPKPELQPVEAPRVVETARDVETARVVETAQVVSPLPTTAPSMRFVKDIVPQRERFPRPATKSVRPSATRAPEPAPPPVSNDETELVDAMRAVLDIVDMMEPRASACPTIMVAANEDGLATTPVALALGRASADRRWRVLLIEADRATPALAAAVDVDAEPLLIDFYGTLRVGLAADVDGSLILAPVLRNAARLASNLARGATTPLIDDLVSAFDLVVIDGAVADDAAAAGWTADAFVRVGSRASRRDDDAFCATFEVASAARLATILSSASSARPVPAAAPVTVSRQAAPRPAPFRPRTQPVSTPAPVATPTPRRKIAAR